MRGLSALVSILLALPLLVLSDAYPGAAPRRDSPRPLPPSPAFSVAAPDLAVRTVALVFPGDQEAVRIAAHPSTGKLYVLGGGGDVWMIDPGKGQRRRVLLGKDYIVEPPRKQVNIPLPIDRKWVNAPITLRATLCLGLCFDRKARLYIVANVQVPGKVVVNRVDLYRTAPVKKDDPGKPRLWTRFQHAYGVGGFNHGACRIAQGPDGLIYLGSGSRTDHGEAGEEPNIGRRGEAPDPAVPGGPGMAKGGDFTASILRFDPEKGQQTPEVFSRGNRNPFGFDWDDKGRLIDAEHGPMADHPEEINHIRKGRHYGFPYVFGNNEKPDYPDAPKPPKDLTFEPPIRNLGPGGLLGDHPMYSLAPHSAPGGMVFYRKGSLPKRYEKSFFLARFGNLVNYNRIGFDVLNIRIKEGKDGKLEAHTERFLDRLSRPIDVCVAGGKLYVVEYCRQNETLGDGSDGYTAPGRVLEVTGKK
jgi:glucose/arabinose dehydrogenase